MPRIRTYTMDGVTVRLAPMSYDESEIYIKEGQELLKKEPKTTAEEWAKRTLETVVASINRAEQNSEMTVQKLTKEFDMVFINFLYDEFLKLSGLRPAEPGEGKAAPVSTLP